MNVVTHINDTALPFYHKNKLQDSSRNIYIYMMNVKTAVYTNVNGNTSYKSKTAKIKKVILPSNISPNVNGVVE